MFTGAPRSRIVSALSTFISIQPAARSPALNGATSVVNELYKHECDPIREGSELLNVDIRVGAHLPDANLYMYVSRTSTAVSNNT